VPNFHGTWYEWFAIGNHLTFSNNIVDRQSLTAGTKRTPLNIDFLNDALKSSKHNVVEPLLCNDCEISKYTRVVAKERLGRHVPAATDMHATVEELLETVCST
jgi:hypothetical protein